MACKGFLVPNIQLFAEASGASTGGTSTGSDTTGSTSTGSDTSGATTTTETTPPATNTGDQTSTQNSGTDKTFTQAEVTAMMAREKSQGKNSVLKELGVKDAKSAKDMLTNYQKYLDSQKDATTLAAEKATAAETAKTEAENQVTMLQHKFDAVTAGVTPTAADDVVQLAMLRVTDDKDFKTALDEVKTAYPALFTPGSETTTSGTGGTINGRTNLATSVKGIGARLGQSSAKAPAKSNFFSR